MDSLELHNKFFVYYSLIREGEQAIFLSVEKAKFLCTATTSGELYALGDMPALVVVSPEPDSIAASSAIPKPSAEKKPRKGDASLIRGELFEIFDPVTFFETLDVIEGYWPNQPERSLFIRKLINVDTENGKVAAWAYILNLPVNGLPRFDGDTPLDEQPSG
jgi:gamma-glutamylcyclotransferase (GGCT)/AIG2-like uncharacterized protein YtfP